MMKKFYSALLHGKIIVLALAAVAVIVGALLLPGVESNYDLAKYLPETSNTKKAITIMEKNFGYRGMAEIMLKNTTIADALAFKKSMEAVGGVASVIWLDDYTDVTQPLSFVPDDLLKTYYKENAALFRVEFTENDYSLVTGKAVETIRKLGGDRISMTGSAVSNWNMRNVLGSEILSIILIVVPLCVLILMLASNSWIEPFLYLLVIGISIIINMGTNIIFGSISFITASMAAVLQLAISMDYSLFLSHRYLEERKRGASVKDAIITASIKSMSTIAASALTTIAGFISLLFMRYELGKDIGLVLAKGIGISFICVMTILPILLNIFSGAIEKTRHRSLIPNFRGVGKIMLKLRWAVIPLLILICIPTYLAQRSNNYLYGDSSGSSSKGWIVEEKQEIGSLFGVYNPVMLLIPSNSIADERTLAKELSSQPYVKNVQALVTLADAALPRDLLPNSVKSSFLSGGYSRMIVELSVSGENDQVFNAVEQLQAAAEKYYPGKWYTAGASTSIEDIKSTVESDSLFVSLFSIIAVGLIVLFTFRSLFMPVLLVAVIEISIWINMSFPYFQNHSLVFIGYLIVSSLQLGATIDYAILMGNRYIEFRHENKPIPAALSAISAAGGTVITSALILSVAGFSYGFLSGVPSISDIGLLLGRGAALSGAMVLLVLPPLLVICDPIILRTGLGLKDVREAARRRQ